MRYRYAERARYLMQVLRSGVAVFTAAAAIQAAVTITVNEGERHTFGGFGGSVYHDGIWNTFPEDKRMEMMNLVYRDLNFRFVRVWTGMEFTANSTEGVDPIGRPHLSMVQRYGQYIDDVKAVNPDITLLLGPCAIESQGHFTTPIPQYAEHFVTMLKELRDEHGIKFDVTGVMNEPNANGRVYPNEVPQLVKAFRNEMDRQGLDDVKLIAPECWGVDKGCFDMFDALLNDQEAVDALAGFGTHCYGFCVTGQLADWLAEYNKEHWQTESSKNGIEAPIAFLSGMNLGITHWTHFFAFYEKESEAQYMIIGYDKTNGDYEVYSHYYYYRALVPVLVPGTVMRQCVSSGGNSRMEWTQRTRPPQAAAMGVSPDGRIVMAVANGSGATDVAWVVKELEGKGDKIAMEMWRASGSGVEEAGTVTLDNGHLTVNVGSGQMLAIRSVEPFFEPTAADYRGPVASRHPPSGFALKCLTLPTGGASVRFTVPRTHSGSTVPVRIVVHSLTGRRVARLADGEFGAGEHTVVWDGAGGAGAPAGAYVLRLRSGGLVSTAKLVIR